MDLGLPETSVKNPKTSEMLDRISLLPNETLRHILSFLPTKLAAQTGILSKRWRNLWISVPVLDFDMRLWADFEGTQSAFNTFAKNRMKKFTEFVDRLVAVRGNLSTRKFKLACDFDQVDSQFLHKWMSTMRDVEELDLELWNFAELPGRHFEIPGESLKVMKLNGFFNIPYTLSFPCLEILHLNSVNYVDDLSIKKLLSSCTNLQELQIQRIGDYWDNAKNFIISVPSLKRLTLDFGIHEMNLYDSEAGVEFECKLHLDAPNLEYLKLDDYMSGSITVNCVMPSVTRSHVQVIKVAEFREQSEQHHIYVCELFHSIPNVKYLTIGCFTMGCLGYADDITLPMFHNLVYLDVEFDAYNDAAGSMLLPTLLESSPILETLVLPRGITSPSQVGFLWKPPQNVPHCLLFTLKAVEIRGVTGEVEEELKLLKYFLKNGLVLERMSILCEEFIISGGPWDNVKERTSAAWPLVDRFPFRDELLNYARGSAGCQLDIQIPEPRCFN